MSGHENDFMLWIRALLGLLLGRRPADYVVKNLSPLACGACIFLEFWEKFGITDASMKKTVGCGGRQCYVSGWSFHHPITEGYIQCRCLKPNRIRTWEPSLNSQGPRGIAVDEADTLLDLHLSGCSVFPLYFISDL